MKEQIYFRNAVGDLVAWRRTHIRVLTNTTPGPAGTTKPADETNPVFGLEGVTGERIIAFAPEWRPFTYLAPDRYTSPDARDAFVRDLQAVRLYPPEFAPKAGMNGKGTERDLVDLSDDEFERLLNSLADYCAEKQAGRTLNIGR